MGYTNKTSHYELPQYVANDKPSWLGDFNAAMLKIDTAMADNDATAEAANSAATGAQTQVAALSSQLSTIQGQVNTAVDTATAADGKATTAQTVAGEANTNASEAKTLAGEAKTLAQAAKTSADTATETANNANTLASAALPKSGGVMSGNLILNGAPTEANQAATKQYVDEKSGGDSATTPFTAISGSGAMGFSAVVIGSVVSCQFAWNGSGTGNNVNVATLNGNPFNLVAGEDHLFGAGVLGQQTVSDMLSIKYRSSDQTTRIWYNSAANTVGFIGGSINLEV